MIILVSATIAFASWQVAGWIRGDKGSGVDSASVSMKDGSSTGSPEGKAGERAEGEVDESDAVAGEGASLEAAAAVSPDERYVTETQRHQNFLIALAEGRIKRLDMVATDVQPAGDPSTSYVYVIITTSDGKKTDGTLVMKYSGGMWRLGAVRLTGSLAGGVNIKAPSSFEADLAREMEELQEFWTRVAEGRLNYIAYTSRSVISDIEVNLSGQVGGKGGGVYPAEMRLRKDYGLWHITNITCL